jgi:radical SAM protein with 4Fe4S-binding SPASM domain
MDMQLYKDLIDELKDSLVGISFFFQGEPLFHKELSQMIAYAHNNQIYTYTSTNGTLINDQIARQLVESGLDKLIVSIDGATQTTYSAYRVGGDFQKVIDGVEKVLKWRNDLGLKTPLVELQCVVLKTNESELHQILELGKRIKVDRVKFKSAQLYDFEKGHPLMTTIERYSRYKLSSNGNYVIKSKLHNRCWRMWSGAVVGADGAVLPCCYDKLEQHRYGYVTDNGFVAAWQNVQSDEFKKQLRLNRNQFEMCRNCTS